LLKLAVMRECEERRSVRSESRRRTGDEAVVSVNVIGGWCDVIGIVAPWNVLVARERDSNRDRELEEVEREFVVVKD
jgi:hypothetical protein